MAGGAAPCLQASKSAAVEATEAYLEFLRPRVEAFLAAFDPARVRLSDHTPMPCHSHATAQAHGMEGTAVSPMPCLHRRSGRYQ